MPLAPKSAAALSSRDCETNFEQQELANLTHPLNLTNRVSYFLKSSAELPDPEPFVVGGTNARPIETRA
jgi:hypothetical protein